MGAGGAGVGILLCGLGQSILVGLAADDSVSEEEKRSLAEAGLSR